MLTFGIAVYNIKEDYLRKCIESVISNKGDNIEIMIVDDCSNDSCSETCRNYTAIDNRIRYIRNEKNIGIGGVRNRIISESNGQWIAFVDGDDYVSHHFTEAFFKVDTQSADVIIFEYKSVPDNNGDTDIKPDLEKTDCTWVEADTVCLMSISAAVRGNVYNIENKKMNLHPSCVFACAYRRSFLKANNLKFDESLKTAEDGLFNANVYSCAPCTKYVNFLSYFYRTNFNSVTKRYDSDSKIVTDMYLKSIGDFLNEKYKNNLKVREYFALFRCASAITDNFERNIFHHDNPKSAAERKHDFDALLSCEPYNDLLKHIDVDKCANHKQRLVLKLAKKRLFFALDFAYKHKSVFIFYGGISRRLKKH